MNYFISRAGQQYGPYRLDEMHRYLASGNILATDLARSDGMEEWAPVSQVVGNVPVTPAPPSPAVAPGNVSQAAYAQPVYAPQPAYALPQPPLYAQPVPANYQPPKSRIAFILLGVFLGHLGVHNFYAGYTSKGIAQLLITLLTCGFGAIVTFIWAIIEICTVDKDSNSVYFN